jgi:hypothetical protein
MVRNKPPTEPEQVAPVEPPHIPVVAVDDLAIPKQLAEIFDKAAREGRVPLGDDRRVVRRDDVPIEVGLVHLPKSMFGYVNYGNPRPAEKWLPCWHLQRAAVDGFNYLSAKRLYVEPSMRIFEALEHCFNRGDEPRPLETYAGGALDHTAKKMNSVERIEVEALIEHDNSGRASSTQYVKCRGTLAGSWLPVRRLSKVHAWRPERPQRTFPDLKIL